MHQGVRAIRIVNVADVSSGDAFLDLAGIDDLSVSWTGHSGVPSNAIERAIRRPKLARYRAAWRAVSDAKASDIVISHLPRMTAAVADLMRMRNLKRPHLAFSFNFTDLPERLDLARMSRAFADVQGFCVYSKFESELYPRLFELPSNRFHHVMWAQDVPETDRSAAAPDGPYVIAIGGEGRDYAAILSAARARPDVHWLVIARPNAMFDQAPSNVTAMFNVPAPLTWGLAERAAAVVVPLKTDKTCCGHITIVSAQLLGLPLITTRSMATHEYVDAIPGTVVVEPGDAEALAMTAADMVADPDRAKALAIDNRVSALKKYDRNQWRDLTKAFLRAHAS
jgi:hypothetical protein